MKSFACTLAVIGGLLFGGASVARADSWHGHGHHGGYRHERHMDHHRYHDYHFHRYHDPHFRHYQPNYYRGYDPYRYRYTVPRYPYSRPGIGIGGRGFYFQFGG